MHFKITFVPKNHLLNCYRSFILYVRHSHKELVVEHMEQLRMLFNHLDVQLQPAPAMLVSWFITLLRREFRGLVASAQGITTLDQVQEVVQRIE